MEPTERKDRTWLWIAGAVLFGVIFGFGMWNRRTPANSVEQAAIDNIERQLLAEGFILTNSWRMRAEARPLGIPISRILGTVRESASLPFKKNGTELKIDYGLKANRPFNISIWADPTNSARAREIARKLEQANPKLSVRVW